MCHSQKVWKLGKKSLVTESRPRPYHSCCCRRKCTWLWWTLVLVGVWCFHQCSYSKDSFQLEGVCIDNKWQKFTTVCRFGYLSFLSAYIYFEKCLHPTWCHYFIDSLRCTSSLPFGRKPIVSQAVIQNFWVMSTCSSFAQSHFRILPLKACITSLVITKNLPQVKGTSLNCVKVALTQQERNKIGRGISLCSYIWPRVRSWYLWLSSSTMHFCLHCLLLVPQLAGILYPVGSLKPSFLKDLSIWWFCLNRLPESLINF